MGILDIASIVLVVIFLFATVSFLAYVVRRSNGRKNFAGYAVGVGLLCFVVYLLNILGVIPNPLPGPVGRLVVFSLALVFGLVAIAIWKW